MQIKIHNKIKSKKGLLVVTLQEEQLKKIPGKFPSPVKNFIRDRVKNKDLKGKKGEALSTYLMARGVPGQLLVVGAGGKEKYSATIARELGGVVGKFAKKHKSKEVTILAGQDHLSELTEGFLMAQYNLGNFKTDKKKVLRTEKLNVVVDKKAKSLELSLRHAEDVCQAVDLVKDLVNNPANEITASYMAKTARDIARKNKYKIVVLGDKQLTKMGCGGILAVNKGSDHEAKLVVLEHNGGSRGEKPIVLVGKGVLFDTGGYNLKPTGHIETMQQDMAGAATVFGIFSLLKKLKIKKNIIGITPLVQNMVNASAYRPSDIIKMYSGKTVEVTNTDAEGRMVLADSLHYASQLKPELVITIATLTGAVGVALGERYCGIMGNDEQILDKVKESGESVDELAWPLPIHQDYRDIMESKVADIRNYDRGTGRMGGASKAGAFLEKFVSENKWCHLDIGGSAFTDNPKKYETKGATAYGLRMLMKFLETS